MDQKPRAQGTRASDVHASELPKSNKASSETQSAPDIIDALRFWESPARRDRRRRLDRAQTVAAELGPVAQCEDARDTYWSINRIAYRYMMAELDEATLDRLGEELWARLKFAHFLEHLEGGGK